MFVSHNVSKLVHLDKTLTEGNLARRGVNMSKNCGLYQSGEILESWKLPAQFTIMSAGLYAMHQALKFLETKHVAKKQDAEGIQNMSGV